MKQKMSNRTALTLFVIYDLLLWILDISGWIIFGYSIVAVIATITILLVTVYAIVALKNIFKKKSTQTCFIYCPGCDQDLISRVGVDGTKLHDKTDLGEQYVEYLCGVCKTSSWWDFDTFPVPVPVSASTARAWVTNEDGRLIEIEPWYSEGWWTAE